MARKLWLVEINYKVYVLADRCPNEFEADRLTREVAPEDVHGRAVVDDILGWGRDSLVFHDGIEDITVAEAIEEARKGG